MDGNRLREIPDDRPPNIPTQPAPPKAPPEDSLAMNILLLSLKTLSQKTLIAFGNLFTIFATLSVFCLYYTTLPNPSANQLIGLAFYALFILALHLIRSRP